MTDLAEDPSRDRLKLHFAQRVTHQARQVLEAWQRLQLNGWNPAYLSELGDASLRLQRFAERFEQAEHAQIAAGLSACLDAVDDNRGRLSSQHISELNRLMQRLSRTGLRHNDTFEQTFLPPLRKPVYLCLQDPQRAARLASQLEYFGLTAQTLSDSNAFQAAMTERHPAAILMDIDFAGPGLGLALARDLQQGLRQRLPLLFFSASEPNTPTRLAVVRSGGEELFVGNLDASTLLERIEELTLVAQYDPYKVLIVDDSRAQATHTERVLNSAGIVTRTLTDPIQTMDELADFQPDLIILDMYMPECNGPELAKVIRHNDRYVSVPIIYLSAEDDLEKQLDAMSEGGEDFLTKPIKPRHLISTVRNRAARARDLKGRMVRDSLTGLFNHTHTLQLLEDACVRARRDAQPLTFAMIDIDHFKKVNDSYGHPMGDRVIKSLALFLKQRLRKTDHIGRYGGEEFAVILPDTDAATAARVIDEIRQRFSEIIYPAEPQDLRCTFSCGLAQLSADSDAGSLSQQADIALYQAKHGGRNQVAIFAD
jgi:diguanylate cyclase (GGDEF)-like protein